MLIHGILYHVTHMTYGVMESVFTPSCGSPCHVIRMTCEVMESNIYASLGSLCNATRMTFDVMAEQLPVYVSYLKYLQA